MIDPQACILLFCLSAANGYSEESFDEESDAEKKNKGDKPLKHKVTRHKETNTYKYEREGYYVKW